MGTKRNPEPHDCYENAEPDEPMFVLLGRDPIAPFIVDLWAGMREQLRGPGPKVEEASRCAEAMMQWGEVHGSGSDQIDASGVYHSLIRRRPTRGPAPEYMPKTPEQRMGYLVEECGEVLHAAGKIQRWGLESYNPELPEAQRETNRQWLARELSNLEAAIAMIREDLESL